MRIRDFDLIRILSFAEGITFWKSKQKAFFVKKETSIG